MTRLSDRSPLRAIASGRDSGSRGFLLRWSVGMLAAVIVLAPYLSPALAQASCSGRITDGSWTTIPGPDFDDGDGLISDHNVDPADADHIYATNGTTVYVTENACDWKKSYQAEPLGGNDGPLAGASSTQIIDIVSPRPKLVVLLLEDAAGPVARPRVVTSSAGGAPGSWQEGGVGLPPAGSPDFIAPFPREGAVLYVGVDTGGGASDLLYVSRDAGLTFTLRSDLSKTEANQGIDGLRVDPVDGDSLWAHGPGGLFHSTDGGASFTLVDDFTDTDAGPIDIFHAPGFPARILAFTPAEGGSLRSNDGGETFLAGSSPGATDSVDHGVTADQILATAGGRTYIQDPQSGEWFDLRAPTSGTEGVIFHRSGGLSASVHTSTTIERLAAPQGTIRVPPKAIEGLGIDVGFNQTIDQIEKSAKLLPRAEKIVLKPGQKESVRYTLDLPQRYVPLDVYFLVDTSSSMTRTLQGLAIGISDIAQQLEEARIDVRFGLAEYRSYPDVFPPREDEPNIVYRQLVDVNPIGEPLALAIEGLEAAAGGIYDAHMGALLQTATGSGVDLVPQNTPPGVPNGGDVPAGQQARFREVALGKRVVINATDEKFGDDDEPSSGGPLGQKSPPDIPEMPEVLAALNAKGIDHVGLSIGPHPLKDLVEVSSGTGTFAPTEGVDCDGDGSLDLAVGAPLVCKLSPDETQEAINLVDPVVSLLKAVARRVPVGLEVTKGLEVVDDVKPEVYPEVILQSANLLEFDVTYGCTKKQAGERFPVSLRTESSARLNLAVDALVVCKDIPEDEEKEKKEKEKAAILPITPLVPPIVALVIPPPPPLPPPVTEVSSASQINAQSQAQAQGAGAHQEQEEPQLAYVQAYDETKTQGELAMSSYQGRRGQLPFEAVLGAGFVAVGLMSATGLAMRRKLRLQRIRRF